MLYAVFYKGFYMSSFGWVLIVIHPQIQYISKSTAKIEDYILVSKNALQILCERESEWCGTR